MARHGLSGHKLVQLEPLRKLNSTPSITLNSTSDDKNGQTSVRMLLCRRLRRTPLYKLHTTVRLPFSPSGAKSWEDTLPRMNTFTPARGQSTRVRTSLHERCDVHTGSRAVPNRTPSESFLELCSLGVRTCSLFFSLPTLMSAIMTTRIC